MKRTLIEQWAERAPHFRCPDCHKVSFSPQDIRNRYCGRCHLFYTPREIREREEYRARSAESARPREDDAPMANPWITSTFDQPAAVPDPPAMPDPPSFDPGGGSSGGGGASGDY